MNSYFVWKNISNLDFWLIFFTHKSHIHHHLKQHYVEIYCYELKSQVCKSLSGVKKVLTTNKTHHHDVMCWKLVCWSKHVLSSCYKKLKHLLYYFKVKKLHNVALIMLVTNLYPYVFFLTSWINFCGTNENMTPNENVSDYISSLLVSWSKRSSITNYESICDSLILC